MTIVPNSALQQHNVALDAALRVLRADIQKDAKECVSNASSMGSTAIYLIPQSFTTLICMST